MKRIPRPHLRKVKGMWSCTIVFDHLTRHVVEAKASTPAIAIWSAKLKLIEQVYADNEKIRDLMVEVAFRGMQHKGFL